MYFRGLNVEGTVEVDYGSGPSYGSGGHPPSASVEIDTVEIVDWQEFCDSGLPILWLDVSSGTLRLLGNHFRVTGRTLPMLEKLIRRAWGDAIRDELVRSHFEPEF